ncbi:TatA/E family protein of Tat protein translocase [Paenibacillus sp. V4I3]|uniref:twin-arginine translocase TatA/TatE family subunit n=1 Tax=Paenibacillus sp. V4I3 TaxID=3042305 RepID=UPI0027809C88|nr:twin-arginine translocase TatA/TatE family subunit [Paenibacillus sp. V4I3]MDQ0873135.1 TatA/E family protein of Tat protein translocase [Paenibacillus sp. V4I3]
MNLLRSLQFTAKSAMTQQMMEMKSMFQNIGFTELLLIAIVALVLFGPQKLPEIGRVLGRTIRDFKKGAHALLNDEPEETPKPAAQVKPAPQVSTQGRAASSNAVEAGAPSERPAVEFVSAAVSAVEEPSVTPTAPARADAQSASPAAVSAVEEPSVTPTAPARTDAPPASSAAPIAPLSNTRRLPD